MEYVSRETRRTQHAQLLEIIKQEPAAGTGASAEAAASLVDGRTGRERYDLLASLLCGEFRGRASATGDQGFKRFVAKDSVAVGHTLLCRFLYYGPLAYTVFADKTGRPSPLAELSDIMRRSPRVLGDFAGTDTHANRSWEVNAGMLIFPPVFEDVPFVIELNEEGMGEFVLSAPTRQGIKEEIDARIKGKELRRLPGYRSCDALGEVLDFQWQRAIDLCEQTPALFAYDLAD